MPAPDQPEDTAGEVKSTLLSIVDRIAGPKGDSSSSAAGGSNFPVAIALLGAVVVGFSILGIMLVMARRKAARLAAQVRKLEEAKAQVEENHDLAENEGVRNDAALLISTIESDIQATKDRLKALKAKNEARAKTIAEVSDWGDLDVVEADS